GIGLAVVAAGIKRITNEMMMVASEVLAESSPLASTGKGALLPPLETVTELSKDIAFRVAKLAQKKGLALETTDDELSQKIEKEFWLPRYRDYKRASL
ncbi:malic enzyme-like NAD(P)-binding protein, partial [Methylophaga sp.]|uniref:malic enzyme-like NAD(P)-binding protein n=1 Tax=Methylophaga sp. TaxID=2024840 RepID=UPI003F6957AF